MTSNSVALGNSEPIHSANQEKKRIAPKLASQYSDAATHLKKSVGTTVSSTRIIAGSSYAIATFSRSDLMHGHTRGGKPQQIQFIPFVK